MKGFTFLLFTCLVATVLASSLHFHYYVNDDCSGDGVTVTVNVNDCFGIVERGGMVTDASNNQVNFCSYDDNDCKNSTTRSCDTWAIDQCHDAGNLLSYKVTNSAGSTTAGIVFIAVTIVAMMF